jgi:hypothetical protein
VQILSAPHAGAILANYLVVAGGAVKAGGSGVVIIDAGALAASTTGSPSLSGTIYTFTGSGSITF